MSRFVDGMDAKASPRLDRAGRMLVILGGLVTGPLIALPVAVVVLFLAITRGCGFADDCEWSSGLVLLAAVPVALIVALLVAIAGAARGGSDGLVLGGIGGLVVAASALVGLAAAYEQGRPEALAVMYLLALTAGGLALALGAALRLIARHNTRHRARPDGAGPSGP